MILDVISYAWAKFQLKITKIKLLEKIPQHQKRYFLPAASRRTNFHLLAIEFALLVHLVKIDSPRRVKQSGVALCRSHLRALFLKIRQRASFLLCSIEQIYRADVPLSETLITRLQLMPYSTVQQCSSVAVLSLSLILSNRKNKFVCSYSSNISGPNISHRKVIIFKKRATR